MHAIPYIQFQSAQWFWNSLNSLICTGFFFSTGNVLEKITFFRPVLELFLSSKFLTISFLHYNISGCPMFWIVLFVIKYYFNSAQGNLNNRPSRHVTVGPNWSWRSFSKLPFLLDVLWPIVVTPDPFPLFQNEKDSEAGILSFVIMLYLFRVCNQWCMPFMFLLYYFLYSCLLLQSIWLIWYHFSNCKIANHI